MSFLLVDNTCLHQLKFLLLVSYQHLSPQLYFLSIKKRSCLPNSLWHSLVYVRVLTYWTQPCIRYLFVFVIMLVYVFPILPPPILYFMICIEIGIPLDSQNDVWKWIIWDERSFPIAVDVQGVKDLENAFVSTQRVNLRNWRIQQSLRSNDATSLMSFCSSRL